MKTSVTIGTGIAAVGLAGVLMGFAPEPMVGPPDLSNTEIDRVAEHVLQDIAVPPFIVAATGEPAMPPDQAVVGVTLGTSDVQLRLARHSMRAPSFQLIVQQAGGDYVSVPPPPVATYRGNVEGYPGSAVTASIIDGRLTANVDLNDGSGSYVVQPASDFPETDLPVGSHVSFRSADVAPHGGTCGVEEGPRPIDEGAAAASAGDGSGFNTVELGIDSDYFFFADNGLSVSATLLDIEGVMNTVEFVYERDVQITYEITTIVVRTDAGSNPYTAIDADGLLCQFGAQWNSAPFSAIKKDVAQLFTGKPLQGSTIGLAWNGVICNDVGFGCGSTQNLAYSIVESTFTNNFDERVSLSAHELGHNWNAAHCDAFGNDCNIMCSSVGFCGGTVGPNLKFAPVTITSINNYEGSLPCLQAQPATLAPPFSEDFPSTVLDSSNWTWNNLASVSASSSNPPSPPNALRLFSFGSSEYRDSEVRTNFIDLSGQGGLIVSYLTEHVGVEAGESLVVEYRAADLVWRELNTIVSNGVNQTNFVAHQHDLDLAAEAYHDEFRLRFRSEGDDTGDVWYVDDVYVGPLQTGACCAGELCLVFSEAACNSGGGVYLGDGSSCGPVNPCAAPACPEDLSGNGQVDFADILIVIGAWGPCGVCDEDLDGSGDVGFSDILQIIGAWGPC